MLTKKIILKKSDKLSSMLILIKKIVIKNIGVKLFKLKI